MTDTTDKRTGRARDYCYLFVMLFGTWLVLTSSLQWQELVAGAVISVVLAVYLGKTYAGLGIPPLSLKRIGYFIAYLAVLFVEVVRANLEVAWIVLQPKLPIRPGIVAVKTDLTQDIAKTILANSITLTPGTFTLDIIDDTLLIHWIVVRSDDSEEAARLISGRFEKYLKAVFA
ncbi:Na+/H+ antiporter subunit E [bacterium]|nr:Na+/H+ antiporter subunit E [bacterium]